MAWIDDAWLRSAFESLRATFGNDPHLKNAMVQFLMDEGFWSNETLKSWDAAMARFNACLNPNKSEFFKIGEVWALMKRFDRPQLFEAMAADLGYEVRRIPTEARRQELLERIAVAHEECNRNVAGAHSELLRLAAAPTPEAPRTHPLAVGPGRFSMDWGPTGVRLIDPDAVP